MGAFPGTEKLCSFRDYSSGLFDTAEEAKKEAVSLAERKNRKPQFTVTEEEAPEKGTVMLLNDVPVSFGVMKKYRDRVVTVIPAAPEG